LTALRSQGNNDSVPQGSYLGGKVTAKKLTPEQRKASASKAASSTLGETAEGARP